MVEEDTEDITDEEHEEVEGHTGGVVRWTFAFGSETVSETVAR